jgi:hypothetical protein
MTTKGKKQRQKAKAPPRKFTSAFIANGPRKAIAPARRRRYKGHAERGARKNRIIALKRARGTFFGIPQ